MTTAYVLGFAFDKDLDEVLLIKKNRPEWQAGLHNGIGGKVESFDESTWASMSREFKEEAGIETEPLDWNLFAVINGPDFKIDCFWTVTDIYKSASITDEEVSPWDMSAAFVYYSTELCPNVGMLIAMAKSADVQNGRIDPVVINYNS